MDYWAGALLIASTLGIGSKMELIMRYRNVPILWLMLVGDVSPGKSNPLEFCLSYFKKLDNDSIRKYDENLEEYNRFWKMMPKELMTQGLSENPKGPNVFSIS